jgi:hypothetical protein
VILPIRSGQRLELPTSRWLGLLAMCLASAPAGASGVYGTLGNFDVVNDTGGETCGFEIEIEDVHGADVYRTFQAPHIRYGAPTLTDTPTGVLIRYKGAWDPGTQTFLQKTPPAAPGYVPRSDSCWTGGLGAGYDASGCEHFGVSHSRQARSTRYRWLSCNPDGSVSPLPDLGLPTPVWSVQPPPAPGNPEVVRAEVEIPNPEGDPYGPPYWMKIYKTEVEHPIVLENLLLDDAIVAAGEVEIEWELVQSKPGQELVFHEAPLAEGAEAVVRRYEFYHYDTAWGRTHTYVDPDTGENVPYVDPENGEVQECVVDGCNAPTDDELGDYIGRQMAGVNLGEIGCANGVDDDADGLVDLDDPGCDDAADIDERSPLLACDDDADNDGDGRADFDPATLADPAAGSGDPGCRGPGSQREDPQCQDGVNNDGEAGTDFDGGASVLGAANADPAGADPDCAGKAWRAREKRSCGIGFEVALLLPALRIARRRRGLRA